MRALKGDRDDDTAADAGDGKVKMLVPKGEK